MEQFKQQMLKAWQPVPTLTKTILLFFIMSLIFLGSLFAYFRYLFVYPQVFLIVMKVSISSNVGIGIPMIILSKGLTEVVYR